MTDVCRRIKISKSIQRNARGSTDGDTKIECIILIQDALSKVGRAHMGWSHRIRKYWLHGTGIEQYQAKKAADAIEHAARNAALWGQIGVAAEAL